MTDSEAGRGPSGLVEGEVVWLTCVEYGRLYDRAYSTTVEMCRKGDMPGARKDPVNGYFWQIPGEKEAYEAMKGPA